MTPRLGPALLEGIDAEHRAALQPPPEAANAIASARTPSG